MGKSGSWTNLGVCPRFQVCELHLKNGQWWWMPWVGGIKSSSSGRAALAKAAEVSRWNIPLFLLFSTLFHQQRESVSPTAQQRFDLIAPSLPGPDKLRIEYFGELIAWERLDSLAAAERLRGQHIWRDEVIAERFDWGKSKNIFALAVQITACR